MDNFFSKIEALDEPALCHQLAYEVLRLQQLINAIKRKNPDTKISIKLVDDMSKQTTHLKDIYAINLNWGQ